MGRARMEGRHGWSEDEYGGMAGERVSMEGGDGWGKGTDGRRGWMEGGRRESTDGGRISMDGGRYRWWWLGVEGEGEVDKTRQNKLTFFDHAQVVGLALDDGLEPLDVGSQFFDLGFVEDRGGGCVLRMLMSVLLVRFCQATMFVDA